MTLYTNARIAEIDNAIAIYRNELNSLQVHRQELDRRQAIAWAELQAVLYADQPQKLFSWSAPPNEQHIGVVGDE